MKNFLLKAELREIFTNKKILIPIIAVLFVPVMYAGVFLWAFWNPYGKLDKLPVAVVNSDAGANFDGDHLKIGNDLVKELKDGKNFKFHFVGKKEGYQGLKDEKYYMLIEIPKDFSKNATTLLDHNPKKLKLIYVPNEGYNFLSSQIGKAATGEIKTAVSQKVTETYAETMFSKVKLLANGIEKASDGAGKLKDGTVKLNNGAKDLKNGLTTLAEKSIVFDNGMQKADSGAKKLAAGSDQLNNGLATLAQKSIIFNTGMQTANSGASQVASGSKNLTNGLGQLQTGHSQLEAASGQLAEGSKQLADNLKKSDEGIQTMNSQMPKLVKGTADLQTGAENLSKGLNQWQQGSDAALTGAEQVNQGIVALKQQLEKLMQAPAFAAFPADQKAALAKGLQDLETGSANLAAGTKSLNESAGQLSSGASTIAEKLGEVNQGQVALKEGIANLANGSPQLVAGADKLAAGEGDYTAGMQLFGQKLAEAKTGGDQLTAGSSNLASGMTQLAYGSSAIVSGAGQLSNGSQNLEKGASGLSNGTKQLASGAQAMTSGAGQLADGSKQLANGTNDLSNGSKQLAGKLADGSKDASRVHADKKTYNMMADPVKLSNEKINKVPNYGTGFAPYFISLGLFVGALLISIVFPLRQPAVSPASGFSWFAGKLIIISMIGIIQSLVVDFIVLTGLGLDVQSTPRFILFTILTSLTFITLIQFLVTALGDPGRFVAIILLILQLTTSAGTFPLELTPTFLQHFNAFLPMTYSVRGFKDVISNVDIGMMWKNAEVLILFIAMFMLCSLTYFTMRFRYDYKRVESQGV
ncbi:YhgE/Pip domain-containing protein [Paenibacillus sp. BSR1-1]|uniref:YhgE/Pip domain-containing protein n=1 Tax=Paenibacillus sp. BSR1-1 TaxID=3020845 RepID=UPI0025B19E58|nr:YhgE/Pip domain-containing protein [Paenibacillus sp. BSR1-1]MDN3014617.1 YhgE/Pip domain-containing protein [Paenibacillus sp. BSR1-1]